MNFIQLDSDEMIDYPVGRDMQQTMPIVKDMAMKLRNLYPLHEYPNLQFYVRGSSGAIIGGIITAFLPEYEVRVFHIKKSGESSHSGGYVGYNKYYPAIIVDDFVSSGETVNAIYAEGCKINSQFKVDTICVSAMLFMSSLSFKPTNVIAGNYKDN